MKGRIVHKRVGRMRRHARSRARLSGTAQRPRLSVFRSANYIYAQLIDDAAGRTLAAASSLQVRGKKLNKTQQAGEVGKLIAGKARQLNINTVVFDRGGYRYHGRVQSLAEAARASGLQF